jgi:hypothetical protein
MVTSPNWSNGGEYNSGAFTWGSGTSGVAGPINALNSAVGLVTIIGVPNTTWHSENVNDTVIVPLPEELHVLVGSQAVGFTAVRAGSTEWSTNFTELVDPVLKLGYIIPPDAGPLPWTNLNRLSVTFTNAIEKAGGGTLTADDFDLRGVNQADYNALVTGFSYDSTTRTATFTLSQPIQADRLLVRIHGGDVQDAAGHVQFGQYDFRFDVLPGDYTRNGVVDASDYVVWRKGQSTNGSIPFYVADANGDGMIDDADHGVWRANYGNKLPLPEESATNAVATIVEDPTLGRRPMDNPLSLADGEPTRATPVVRARPVGARLSKRATAGPTSQDEALVAWLATRGVDRFAGNDDRAPTTGEGRMNLSQVSNSATIEAFFAGFSEQLSTIGSLAFAT